MSVPREIKASRLLTIGEVAAIMGVHRGTVWKWIKDGCLAATVPTKPDPENPERQIPVSSRYRGVKPDDLARWKSVYRPAVSPAPSRASKATKKSKRARKRAKSRR